MKDQVVATIISLQVGQPRTVGSRESSDSFEEVWTTGFFKRSTSESLWLSTVNLTGDGQADLVNHGGPEKAVNVYPVEHYPYWLETLPLPDLGPGAFGENFTTDGLMESDVCIGDVFEIGESLVQVSQPRQPCWKLARRWGIKDLALRVQETGRTGWYFRVLREGHVQAGNRLLLVERHHPNLDGVFRKRGHASSNTGSAGSPESCGLCRSLVKMARQTQPTRTYWNY